MIFIILSVSFKFLLIFYLYILKFNLQFLMVKLYWVDSIERRFALAQKWRAIWMVEGDCNEPEKKGFKKRLPSPVFFFSSESDFLNIGSS